MAKIIAPIYMTFPRKTKKDKKVMLWMNRYRNAHYFEQNTAKVSFKQLIEDQVASLGYYDKPPFIYYKYYFQRKWSDVNNVHSVITKFFLDVLVTMGKIKDDTADEVKDARENFIWYDKDSPRVEIYVYESFAEHIKAMLSEDPGLRKEIKLFLD